jgi:glucose/arabinose dehydrogenase
MKKNQIIWTILVIILIGGLSIFAWQRFQRSKDNSNLDNNQPKEAEFQTEVEIVVEGLDHPWDIKVDDSETIYFTQRQLGLYKYNGEVKEVYIPEDLYTAGEGGMLGFDIAPDFKVSREIYACFNSSSSITDINVVVARLKLSEDFSSLESRNDIITDIESAVSGRHSGCRIKFDRNDENIIWVTTGDAASANNPQDPESLNGKVLRINREGEGVEGNLGEPFDPRIFSYGHRNIQGITLFDEYDEVYGYGLTAEHGPNVDDEINPLIKGNFGWDPKPPYLENVPMTDLDKYPDAIQSAWSSGERTVAACGIEYVESGPFEGDVLLATLKDSYVFRFEMGEAGELNRVEEVIMDYGRIRQIYEAPNGRLFFTTDNGGNDVIAEIVFK